MKKLLLLLAFVLIPSFTYAIEKNVAGQKWSVFCFDETDATEKTGDAAQITGSIWIDGVENAIDDLHPTEMAHGGYIFDVTQAESNGEHLYMDVVSSTANIQCVGCPRGLYTRSPAQSDDVIQTGDSYAVVNHADHGNAKLVRSTTPANKLDVSATGEAGLDFNNIKNAAAPHTLANITVPNVTANADQRGTDGANTTVPDAAGVAPTAVEIRQEIDNNSTRLDADITSRAPANEYDTQMGYIPSDLGSVPTSNELDSQHGDGPWRTY